MTIGLPYQEPTLPIGERIADLIARMTLAEKVGQMLQLDARQDVAGLIEHYHVGSILHTSPADMLVAARCVQQTRLRIPLLTADDCIHGHSFWPGATIFPTQLGMACSWDPALMQRVGRAVATEVAATGLHWTFSPVLCIARDLRWGRVGETFGEDPQLIGDLGVAMIQGYQGDGLADPTAILACAKHFAGYSETQGGRDASEADLSPRKLRAWFLPPFERAARAGCRSFMLGYQSIDGVPITANEWLLKDVLKGEWGFTGTLVTDWDNVGRMVWEQKTQPDHACAAAVAVKAGNDLVMTTPGFFDGAQEAIRRGLLTEADLDQAVARVLRLKFELGLFENPRLPDPARQAAVIGAPAHTELNHEVARRSLVLLRNDGLLPLPATRPLRIAVVGPNADDPHAQLGDWAGASGQIDWMPDGHPRALTCTVLDGLRALAPAGSSIVHARGADIAVMAPDPDGTTFPDGQPRPWVARPASADAPLLAQAVAAAQASDVVVAVVGDSIALVGESRSTATLELFGAQIALLDALAATGKPMVVVLLSSKPLVLPPSALQAAAIVCAFNPGMRGGLALAELLWGHIEPSGRLPISFARHAGQLPIYYNQINGQHGHRYADLSQEPQFAFGEGLSYTTIVCSDLSIAQPECGLGDTLRARITLANTGSRPALETVQVYVRDLVTSVTWACLELKAYRQVWVEPGQRVVVPVDLPVSDCTLVNARGQRVVEPGEFELLVGTSSRPRDLLAARFSVR
ncbi:MAG: glycoside hydrolase family 3 C-terminal domain-containing protein [Ideonella sp.]|nr:glycoside hydrolase family 3 C-terminal domain-containing protein [Ideonella sp.]